jgi:hypothetical protein
MGEGFDSGMQSPRPETPEPGSQQGRRNAQPGVQLLDDDGGISVQVGLAPLCECIASIHCDDST